MTLYDFNKDNDPGDWSVVDDVVMGGRSSGQFELNSSGNAVFHGSVSLENNGGFSSVRHRFDSKDISAYSKINIRLKGDGKSYQFRAKSNSADRHTYIYTFETSGEWQVIEIQMADMRPTFRGRSLDLPNYPGQIIEEIAFLIANKKSESFELEIDMIELN